MVLASTTTHSSSDPGLQHESQLDSDRALKVRQPSRWRIVGSLVCKRGGLRFMFMASLSGTLNRHWWWWELGAAIALCAALMAAGMRGAPRQVVMMGTVFLSYPAQHRQCRWIAPFETANLPTPLVCRRRCGPLRALLAFGFRSALQLSVEQCTDIDTTGITVLQTTRKKNEMNAAAFVFIAWADRHLRHRPQHIRIWRRTRKVARVVQASRKASNRVTVGDVAARSTGGARAFHLRRKR